MKMNESTVYDCTIIELDKHHSDRKGNISVVENSKDVPFDVKRTYYLPARNSLPDKAYYPPGTNFSGKLFEPIVEI